MVMVMVISMVMVMGGAAGCAEEVVANKFLAQGRNSSTPISCPITLEIARSRLISKSKGMFSLFFLGLFTSATIFYHCFQYPEGLPPPWFLWEIYQAQYAATFDEMTCATALSPPIIGLSAYTFINPKNVIEVEEVQDLVRY